MNLNLRKFNMSKIKFDPNGSEGPVVVMIGKRGTGKSFLVKDMLYYHKDIPVGAVISGTEAGNGFYSEIVPKIFIHNEYSTDIIENALRRQKSILKRLKKMNKLGKNVSYKLKQGTSEDPRMFIILDDCLFDSKWTRDVCMRLLFMNGRHWKIMLIITMQYPLGIPPVLRTNIDYVFILREPIKENRERIYKSFAGMFPTFDAFNQVMDQCTENFNCLVVDNTTRSNKLDDQVFWYKAQEHKDYKIGSKQFWEASKNIQSDDEDEEEYDPTVHSKRRGPRINVKKNKW